MRLAQFILGNLDSILQEWDAFARTVETSQPALSPRSLRNHAEQILKTVAKDLLTPQTAQQQQDNSRGLKPVSADATAAQTYAVLRLTDGFSLDQMVAEYRALRASVLRLWLAHEQGPVLVIAGAGSGKTRIITARIAHLIVNKHVDPTTIVALTFTNKAAQEMRERIIAFIGQQIHQPFLGTFHAYCLRLLREYGSFIGLKSFGILDEIDQETLVKKILGPVSGRHVTPRQALHQLSLLKNSAIIDLSESSLIDHYTRELYQRYEAEKKLSNCLDFDDLLLYTIKLFEHAEFKKIIRNHVRHLLVDEYQDTNAVQHVLLKHLALEKNTCAIDSLCVVGDEDQAIYSWRGATIENITQFSNQIINTTLVTIEQNYRSAKQILDAANQIITNNTNRHPKKLWSTRTGKNCIVQLACASDNQEAELVARAAAITRQHKTSTTFAVLYRAHFQSRAIEEALVRHSVPYRIIGGVQFYERKEVKDILAYVRLVANPFDHIAFARIINCPTRALGEKFVELFFEYWGNCKNNFGK